MVTFVIAKDGTKLMPTYNIRKVRRMLSDGHARIYGHNPFTVQLTYESEKHVQPIELCEDTGDRHIGLSVKSEKHEFVSAQYDHLKNETEHHDDCRKYRRTRRNRKRYCETRFNNRKRKTQTPDDKWLAPSVKNKELNHLRVMERYAKICPITDAWFECGSFDTQTLQAIEAGKPLPQGKDFQNGPRYGFDTLREAVFERDAHKCICCGKGIDEGKILRIHHLGFKTGDHTNRMSNLATVCTNCHTAAAHKPGGKLYELDPKLKTFKGASFMTSMRFQLIKDAKVMFPDTKIHMCYGAATKRERHSKRIAKTHANDAYCIGLYRPKHRSHTKYYQKCRRNNRILEKFYDAKIIDVRDGEPKKGAELGCNRTNRKAPKKSPNNLRMFRGEKLSKGKRVIRSQRYEIQPGDQVMIDGTWICTKGTHNKGTRIITEEGKSIAISHVKAIRHCDGWIKVNKTAP